MAKNDDFYIAMLKYGRDAMKKSEMVIYNDFKKHMDDIHPNFMPDQAFGLCFYGYFDPLSNFGKGTSNLDDPDISYVIKNEAYFQLLEYEELQEARASSKNALRVAIIAILLSTAVSGFSAWQQFTTPHMLIDDPVIVRLPHVHSY